VGLGFRNITIGLRFRKDSGIRVKKKTVRLGLRKNSCIVDQINKLWMGFRKTKGLGFRKKSGVEVQKGQWGWGSE
jgi:hypothetical protein